jgi:hypothetical protein
MTATTQKARNKREMIKLPLQMTLVAALYGTGKDDYLAVVLGYDAGQEKYVTWVANTDAKNPDGTAGCSEGHYFSIHDSAYARQKYAETGDPVSTVEFRRRNDLHESAFADFVARCGRLSPAAVWKQAGVGILPD